MRFYVETEWMSGEILNWIEKQREVSFRGEKNKTNDYSVDHEFM